MPFFMFVMIRLPCISMVAIRIETTWGEGRRNAQNAEQRILIQKSLVVNVG
jgi:hypothetical protein